jgi:hypothetical protein
MFSDRVAFVLIERGGRHGAGAGWHYLIRRFHDPATGQFLSVAGRVHCTAICRSDISSVEPRELGELDRTM